MAIKQGTSQPSKSQQLPKAQFPSSWIVGKRAKISTKANTASQKLCLEGKLALLQATSATGFKAIPRGGKKINKNWLALLLHRHKSTNMCSTAFPKSALLLTGNSSQIHHVQHAPHHCFTKHHRLFPCNCLPELSSSLDSFPLKLGRMRSFNILTSPPFTFPRVFCLFALFVLFVLFFVVCLVFHLFVFW